jgi:hypothetical protein
MQHVDASLIESVPQCTSMAFDTDGLTFMVGTLTGQVVMYDLRRPTPLLVKDHQYGYPIKSLQFHTSGNVLSTDTKICKIWDKNTGNIFTSIEGVKDINDVCVFGGDSGLLMMTNEGVQIQSYYIPALGPAPKWCPFLDNLTEELEENPEGATTYDDYKFITKKELVNLNLEHLIGTNVLKAYMHGFFVDLRLYEKARAIANPFEFEEHKMQMVQKKLKEKQASRISAMRKLPKINKGLAAKLIDEDDDSDEGTKKKKRSKADAAAAESLLQDARFKDLFKDEDYQVDETSHEFRIHNPSQVRLLSRILLPKRRWSGLSECQTLLMDPIPKAMPAILQMKMLPSPRRVNYLTQSKKSKLRHQHPSARSSSCSSRTDTVHSRKKARCTIKTRASCLVCKSKSRKQRAMSKQESAATGPYRLFRMRKSRRETSVDQEDRQEANRETRDVISRASAQSESEVSESSDLHAPANPSSENTRYNYIPVII